MRKAAVLDQDYWFNWSNKLCVWKSVDFLRLKVLSLAPLRLKTVGDEANLVQLVVLTNLESINAMLIKQKISQAEGLVQLNEMAIVQMKSLVNSKVIKRLNQDIQD